MGTRHLITVKRKGKTVVSQYGQFDGYLSCCGKGILNFLAKMDTRKFNKALDNCRLLTPDEVKARYASVGVTGEWLTMDEANLFAAKYPELVRETSFKILDMIYKGKATELNDASGFEEDTTWCEYFYVIDMDKKTLSVSHNAKEKPFGKVKFADLKANPAQALKYLSMMEEENPEEVA